NYTSFCQSEISKFALAGTCPVIPRRALAKEPGWCNCKDINPVSRLCTQLRRWTNRYQSRVRQPSRHSLPLRNFCLWSTGNCVNWPPHGFPNNPQAKLCRLPPSCMRRISDWWVPSAQIGTAAPISSPPQPRQCAVDNARRKRRVKHGGDLQRVSLDQID